MARRHRPGVKELKEFGLTMGAALPVIFGLFLPWLFEYGYPVWPWVAGAVFALWGVVGPESLRPVYRGWIAFGHFMGRMVSPVILTLTWVVAVLPTALVMRLVGQDPMRRGFDPERESYRSPSERRERDHFERPF